MILGWSVWYKCDIHERTGLGVLCLGFPPFPDHMLFFYSVISYLIWYQRWQQTQPRSGLSPPTDPSRRGRGREHYDLYRDAPGAPSRAHRALSAAGPGFRSRWPHQLSRSSGCRWWRRCRYRYCSTQCQPRSLWVFPDRQTANFSPPGRQAAAGPFGSHREVGSPPSPAAGLGPTSSPWCCCLEKGGKYPQNPMSRWWKRVTHGAGAGSWCPAPLLVVFCVFVSVSHPLTDYFPSACLTVLMTSRTSAHVSLLIFNKMTQFCFEVNSVHLCFIRS